MKFKFYSLLILFLCIGVTVEAQLFKPFQSFRVIKTEKFDIIYPKESESSARLLASYADSVYEEVSALFGINVPGRIPVTFAPHTEMFNAYYRSVPSPSIVIFDTAMDLELTTFEDNLKVLFIHELVHAITMSARNPYWRALHFIFGNWATPVLWNAPLFMIEGAAISVESLGGFGRANDPLVRQKLRQAVFEDKFHTPFQASGVYDSPGQSSIFYEYGGLFSAWLQEQYGMEKYAELWRAMGRSGGFSFSVYRSGFYRIFNRVYRINFTDVWNVFKESFVVDGIEENPDEILPVQSRFFSENRNSISAIAANGNDVYILDRTHDKIYVFDTQTENVRAFNSGVYYSCDLDVSACGTTLLVSGYHITGNRFKAVVAEHRTDSGRRTGRTINGLYKARYFRDGVIGIQAELHNNCIVYKDFNGNTEILFRGNEKLMFSGPQVLDDERIVFIAARNGMRELMLYNYVSGELFGIKDLTDDIPFDQYMRGINISEGKILFSHNVNDRMYKLACIDLETMRIILSDRDFSGGVFNPVSVNGSVYYRANFFSGDGVMRFPETLSSLTGTQSEITFIIPAVEDYGLITKVNSRELPEVQSITAIESKPYFSIRYMNPFRFWVPMPLFRTNSDGSEISLDGVGLFSLLADPTGRNTISFIAYADIAHRMAMIDTFVWQSTVPGIPITLDFSDKVMDTESDLSRRETRVNLSAGFSQIPGRWSYGFSLGAGYVRAAEDDGTAAAYQWKETASAFYYSANLSLTNRTLRHHELFGKGMLLGFRGINVVDEFKPRFEGRFRASMETPIPLNFVLYGAYDMQGMNLHGVSSIYGGSIFSDSASVEYPARGLTLNWLGGAEVSLGIFALEIQDNLSHFYFNRFFGTLSLRNVLYDSNGHPEADGLKLNNNLRLAQSLVLKLKVVSSVIPLKLSPFYIVPNIWGAWRFSSAITGEKFPWDFGIGFDFTY